MGTEPKADNSATQNTGHLAPAVERFRHTKIVCLGDIMLDKYVSGHVDRISPEAPIPVFSIGEDMSVPGASGNVARNIASLGGKVSLISVIGDDSDGKELVRLLSAQTEILPNIVIEAGRPTTSKMRFVAGGQQLMRADREVIAPIPEATETQVLSAVKDELGDAAILVISDYAKGVITPRVIEGTIKLARDAGVPVVVDPKLRDFTRYKGATLIKPNLRELALATGETCTTDEEIESAAGQLLSTLNIDALLVTRAERGMSILPRGGTPSHLPTHAREVFDVSGAGDTAIATLALGMASGLSLTDAAILANHASGLVVGKRGTATVHPSELTAALHATDTQAAEARVVEPAVATEMAENWRAQGLKVGFTNGCFDLIHTGHVSSLADAKAQCDRLIVGLNTDASVKRQKGPERPINAEMARAIVLASLTSVDLVVLFDDDTPLDLIKAVRPDVLIKGADYTVATVVGSDVVLAYGGRVHLTPIVAGMSTTKTIEKINS